jgi:manganese/iron transport system ATP-binding protein
LFVTHLFGGNVTILDYDNIPSPAGNIEAQGLSIGYPGITILDRLNFVIRQGERVAVVGPNGAGKSTLFKALVGLIPIQEGNILIHGRPLGFHKDCVAYIPQRGEVDWRFPVTVRDVVQMGRFGKIGWMRNLSKGDHHVVEECLRQLRIEQLADMPIGELSGGQQQRVFLARALAQEPHILLMDEPFTGIDITTTEVLYSLFDQLQSKRVTLLVSTHDLGMAASRFDQVMLLKRRLIAYGPAKEVFISPAIKEAFGGQVLYTDGVMVMDHCCPEDDHTHEEETS